MKAVVAQNTVGDAAPEQQALALANEEMPVVVEETAPAETVESAQAAVETETAVVTDAVEAVQTIENTEPVASTEETDVEDEAAKAEGEIYPPSPPSWTTTEKVSLAMNNLLNYTQ